LVWDTNNHVWTSTNNTSEWFYFGVDNQSNFIEVIQDRCVALTAIKFTCPMYRKGDCLLDNPNRYCILHYPDISFAQEPVKIGDKGDENI